MGCRIIGSRVERRRRRASNQSPTASSQRFMAAPPRRYDPMAVHARLFQGVLQGRVVRRLDLQLEDPASSLHPVDAAEEPARRRAGGAFAVGVIDAAVAGAHEQARLGEPLDRAAEVGAVDGQDQERVRLRLVGLLLVAALVADEDAGMGHHAVPRLADGVVEGHQARLAGREIRDAPHGQPSDRGLAGPEEVADEGEAHRGRGDGAEPVSQPAQERAPPRAGLGAGPRAASWKPGPSLLPLVRPKSSLAAGRPALPPGRQQRHQVVDLRRGQRAEIVRPTGRRRRKPASRDRAGR